MNSLQLRLALTEDPLTQSQLGRVCALEELPGAVTRRPKLYIVNTQDRKGLEKHWLALYFPRVGPAECFDSLGREPRYYHWRLHRYLKKHGGYYIYNKRRCQQVGTRTCGQFCLYYAQHRCAGKPMRQILLNFDGQTLDDNEDMVSAFVKERDLTLDLDRLNLDCI